jgi:hypothetical protein
MKSEEEIKAELERIKIELNHLWWVRDKFGITTEAGEGLLERQGKAEVLQWILGIQ